MGDFHSAEESVGAFRARFARVNDDADVLLHAGDLTNWGTAAETRVAVAELAEVEIPIVAVLGNHDHEAGQPDAVAEILRERGVHLLDGDIFQLNDQVGTGLQYAVKMEEGLLRVATVRVDHRDGRLRRLRERRLLRRR